MIILSVKKSKTRWPLKRPQRFYWIARDSSNGNILARSSEMYANEKDCEKAGVKLLSEPAIVLNVKGQISCETTSYRELS